MASVNALTSHLPAAKFRHGTSTTRRPRTCTPKALGPIVCMQPLKSSANNGCSSTTRQRDQRQRPRQPSANRRGKRRSGTPWREALKSCAARRSCGGQAHENCVEVKMVALVKGQLSFGRGGGGVCGWRMRNEGEGRGWNAIGKEGKGLGREE